MKILYLTSRLPTLPLVKGDTLRDFNILKELAHKGHTITLISFYKKGENTKQNISLLSQYAQLQLIEFSLPKQARHLLKGIFVNTPFQVLLYESKAYRRLVEEALATHTYDLAYVHFSRVSQYLKGADIPKVLDLQDNFVRNMKDRFKKEKNPILKLAAFFESYRMDAYEKQMHDTFDFCIYASKRDITTHSASLVAIPNGVDELLSFSKKKKEQSLIFFGNMSYFPNKDAALFLIKKIMPYVWKKAPFAKVYIVGAHPPKALTKVKDPRIVVTGFVPNKAIYFKKAAIAIAPLRHATGIQNKILEAMQAGLPQIATQLAVEGIDGISQREMIICQNNAKEIANHIIRILHNPKKQKDLAVHAKAFLEQHYSWEKSIAQLESVMQKAIYKGSLIQEEPVFMKQHSRIAA